MPRLPPLVITLLSWVTMVTMGGLNAWMVMKVREQEARKEVWSGPRMPGKTIPLPPRPEKKVEAVVDKNKPPYPDEPLRDLVVGDKGSKDAKPPEPAAFEVQAGTFVLKLGAETLTRRLQENGLQPTMEMRKEMVQLNNVQAGPYPTLDAAREAEVKLRSAGVEAVVEDTWEGYVINLGKYYLLGYAMQTMDEAEKLGVTPLRTVKVDAALEVHKVVLGPFSTRDRAKEISARISYLGLAIPVIKEWRATADATAVAKGTDKPTADKTHAPVVDKSSQTPDKGSSEKTAPTPGKSPPPPKSGKTEATPSHANEGGKGGKGH